MSKTFTLPSAHMPAVDLKIARILKNLNLYSITKRHE